MQGAADSVRMAKSSTSRRGDVRMFAGPQVTGDTKEITMSENHMDKAMVAKMGINGFGRIGRLVSDQPSWTKRTRLSVLPLMLQVRILNA